MSDGGEDVRRVQEYLHPNSEHLIDWFHITMRLTVLRQQTKSLQAEQTEIGTAVLKQVRASSTCSGTVMQRKHWIVWRI